MSMELATNVKLRPQTGNVWRLLLVLVGAGPALLVACRDKVPTEAAQLLTGHPKNIYWAPNGDCECWPPMVGTYPNCDMPEAAHVQIVRRCRDADAGGYDDLPHNRGRGEFLDDDRVSVRPRRDAGDAGVAQRRGLAHGRVTSRPTDLLTDPVTTPTACSSLPEMGAQLGAKQALNLAELRNRRGASRIIGSSGCVSTTVGTHSHADSRTSFRS